MKKKINFKEVFPNFITILGLCLGISSIKFAFELNFEKCDANWGTLIE